MPQNLFELWVVSTRPADQNGLGLEPESARGEMDLLKSTFSFLPDTPAIYSAWEDLVLEYRVSGKPAHDTRLVAAMKVHGISAILTFDKRGFSRYRGIEVVDPAEVAA